MHTHIGETQRVPKYFLTLEITDISFPLLKLKAFFFFFFAHYLIIVRAYFHLDLFD